MSGNDSDETEQLQSTRVSMPMTTMTDGPEKAFAPNWTYRENVVCAINLAALFASMIEAAILFSMTGINKSVSITPLYPTYNAQTGGIPSGFVAFQLSSLNLYLNYLPAISLVLTGLMTLIEVCMMLHQWYRHKQMNKGSNTMKWMFVSLIFAILNLDAAALLNAVNVSDEINVVLSTVTAFAIFNGVDALIRAKQQMRAFMLFVLSWVPFANAWMVIFLYGDLTGSLSGQPTLAAWIWGMVVTLFVLEVGVLIAPFIRLIKSLYEQPETVETKARVMAKEMPVSVFENEVIILVCVVAANAIVGWIQFGKHQPL